MASRERCQSCLEFMEESSDDRFCTACMTLEHFCGCGCGDKVVGAYKRYVNFDHVRKAVRDIKPVSWSKSHRFGIPGSDSFTSFMTYSPEFRAFYSDALLAFPRVLGNALPHAYGSRIASNVVFHMPDGVDISPQYIYEPSGGGRPVIIEELPTPDWYVEPLLNRLVHLSRYFWESDIHVRVSPDRVRDVVYVIGEVLPENVFFHASDNHEVGGDYSVGQEHTVLDEIQNMGHYASKEDNRFDASGEVVTVTKRFELSAQHQLLNHGGKCRRPHGHNYIIEISVEGEVHAVDGSSSEGMVVDFGDIKKAYQDRIESTMDHFSLNESLPIKVTTAETMSVWIFKQIEEVIPEVSRVRVWETSNSYVEYSRKPTVISLVKQRTSTFDHH